MEYKYNYISRIGNRKVESIYQDVENVKNHTGLPIEGVGAICFYNGQMVLVYEQDKMKWAMPGGAIEKGENIEEAVIREVKEETNMEVLKQAVLGIQVNNYSDNTVRIHSRSVCIVKPYGDFVADPAGDVTEIKLIDPADYKKYFDWGPISDRMMERALEKVKILRSGD